MTPGLINLYLHNEWANRTLIDACSYLSDDQLDAEDFAGVYGSIRATLLHIVSAQERYVQRLIGATLTQGEEVGFISFGRLLESSDESGARLTELAEDTDLELQIASNFMGKKFEVKRWLILLQAINHATEHRTQIKTMMSAIGVTPPELDGWTFGYASGGLIER